MERNGAVLPAEVLVLLGNNPQVAKTNSFCLHEALVPRWDFNLSAGLSKEDLTNLLNKYELPSNLPSLSPPLLNPEIVAILPKNSRLKDASYVEIQNQLSKSLCSLGQGLNVLLSNVDNIAGVIKETWLTSLCDLYSYQSVPSYFHHP